MTKKFEGMPTLAGLSRDLIVRKKYGPYYFGYGTSAIEDLMKAGLLPLTFPLSEGGRAQAWTGGMILDHIAKMQALAAEEAARAAAVAKDQPPTPQPAGLAAAQKIKKQKLRPPGAASPKHISRRRERA
jgi:hypothetical protein